jgi:hypothetical protein
VSCRPKPNLERSSFWEQEGYFTNLVVALLAPGFHSISGATCGGSSISQWMAKRSVPIWTTMVEGEGSSGGNGNCNIFVWLFFIRTPCLWCGAKASRLLKTTSNDHA